MKRHSATLVSVLAKGICALTAGILFAVAAIPAGAVSFGEADPYVIPPSAAMVMPLCRQLTAQEATQLLPGWDTFLQHEGKGWLAVQYRDDLGVPAGLLGPAIPLTTPEADHAVLLKAARSFVTEHAAMLKVDPDQLGPPEIISLARCQELLFPQIYRGLEVLGGRFELYVSQGRLFFIGSECYPRVEVETLPSLTEEVARVAARQGLPADGPRDHLQSPPRLVICPILLESKLTYRLAYEIAFTTENPVGDWRAYVDAADGQLLLRLNLAGSLDIPVTVRSDVQLKHANDPYTERGNPDELVQANSNTVYTDTSGFVAVPVPLQQPYLVDTELRGRYCNVNRSDGPDAHWSGTGTPGIPLPIKWDDTNSQPAERDCYYTVNRVHRWIKALDPTFTYLDFPCICNVNLNGSCNAYFNGSSINFYKAGGGCVNMAQMADIVIHEYGHFVTQGLYSPSPPPMSSGMADALSDCLAQTILDERYIGFGLYGGNDYIRDGMNQRQYPGTECSGEIYCLSEILMGAMWMTRTNLIHSHGYYPGVAVYDDLLWYTWKTKQFSMPAFLLRLLINDDDNGNLADGTPHWFEICEAFGAHNLPCPEITEYISFTHTPVTDQWGPGGGSYEVVSLITPVNCGTLLPDSVRIFYSTNQGSNWSSTLMTPTGNPDEYHGFIPVGVCASLVDYYLRARSTTGGVATEPSGAPTFGTHKFMVGFLVTTLDDDAEIDRGWTIGAPGDAATAGIWERVNPVGKVDPQGESVQPEDDHTPDPGVNCWVTDGRGGYYLNYDVDGGATTFRSPLFNWNDSGYRAVGKLDFWAFFANELIVDDTLRASVSNDGGNTWKDLVKISGEDRNLWDHYQGYFTDTELPFTDQMMFRFRIADYNTSLTEGAVDDVHIGRAVCLGNPFGACCYSDGSCVVTSQPECSGSWRGAGTDCEPNLCPASSVGSTRVNLVLALENALPNPFVGRTTTRFTLPQAGFARLDIFDSSGRLVRHLVRQHLGPGVHEIVWNGESEGGQAVPSGIYFCRLWAAERSLRATIIRTR